METTKEETKEQPPDQLTDEEMADIPLVEEAPKDKNENQEAAPNDENTSRTGCWRGWCSFPNGNRLGLILAFVATLVALAFSDAATDVCGFLEATITLLDQPEDEQEVRRKIGLNVYEDRDGKCSSWRLGEDKDFVFLDDDIIWVFTRTFVAIGAMFSGILLVLLGTAACIAYPLRVFEVTAWLLQLVALMFTLSFLAFSSDLCQDEDKDCTFHVGAGLMIAGVLCWIPASILTFALAYPLPETDQEQVNEETTDQEQTVVAPTSSTTPSEELLVRRNRKILCFVVCLVAIVIGGGVIDAAVIGSAISKED